MRWLVELHGGTVEARSDGPGRGSEFIVRLPLATSATARPDAGRPSPAVTATPLRILVVDDNADSATSMASCWVWSGTTWRSRSTACRR